MNLVKIIGSSGSGLLFRDDACSEEEVVGQFYNSIDKTHHLARYVPYCRPPREYLCGGSGNFSPSATKDGRNPCPRCFGLPVE